MSTWHNVVVTNKLETRARDLFLLCLAIDALHHYDCLSKSELVKGPLDKPHN